MLDLEYKNTKIPPTLPRVVFPNFDYRIFCKKKPPGFGGRNDFGYKYYLEMII